MPILLNKKNIQGLSDHRAERINYDFVKTHAVPAGTATIGRPLRTFYIKDAMKS